MISCYPILPIRIWRRPLLVAAFAFALSACGASDEGQGVGGVTPSEAKALNEAAAILDAREADAQTALKAGSASDTE